MATSLRWPAISWIGRKPVALRWLPPGAATKWLPEYRQSTPETIWDHWGLTREQAERGRLNPKMFNAFLDGSKPAIECAAIANATGLAVPKNGLAFPPGSAEDIPRLMRPKAIGGCLDAEGMVEVASCLTADGKPIPYDIRKGVWVCFRGDTDYIRNCFEEYKVITDDTGRYMSLYKKWHLIGLELGVSVAAVGLRGESTGPPPASTAMSRPSPSATFRPAKCSMVKADTRFQAAAEPAADSVAGRYLPLGLAHKVKLIRPVMDGQPVTYDDVDIGPDQCRLPATQGDGSQLRHAGGLNKHPAAALWRVLPDEPRKSWNLPCPGLDQAAQGCCHSLRAASGCGAPPRGGEVLQARKTRAWLIRSGQPPPREQQARFPLMVPSGRPGLGFLSQCLCDLGLARRIGTLTRTCHRCSENGPSEQILEAIDESAPIAGRARMPCSLRPARSCAMKASPAPTVSTTSIVGASTATRRLPRRRPHLERRA